MKLAFPSFSRRQPAFERAAARHACQVDGEVLLTDSQFGYEGRLTDISSGGAMFRPRLAYLMRRRGVPVSLRLGPVAIEGEIVATTPAGFGIRFTRPLEKSRLDEVLALSQLREAQAI